MMFPKLSWMIKQYGRVCELLKNMPGGTTGRVLLRMKSRKMFQYYGLREEIDTISDRRIDLSAAVIW